jgi:hypothetical protein
VQGGGYKLCYTALDVLQPLISVLENYIRWKGRIHIK